MYVKVLLVAASLLMLYFVALTSAVIKFVGKEIARDISIAFHSNIEVVKDIYQAYRHAIWHVEEALEKVVLKSWGYLGKIGMHIKTKVDIVLTAYFKFYDYIRLDAKPAKDLTENWLKLTTTPLNSEDIQNIWTMYAMPMLEITASKMSAADASTFWRNITERLATVPDAARSIEIELGLIVQKKGDYFMSKRFGIHKDNYDETAAAEEPIAVNDNVIYINEASKIANKLAPKSVDEELKRDETVLHDVIEELVGLKYKELGAWEGAQAMTLIANILHVPNVWDASDDDYMDLCREILMGRVINPYKGRHFIPEVNELKFVNYVNPKDSKTDSTPSFLSRQVEDSKEGEVVLMKSLRTSTDKYTDEELDKLYEQRILSYKAEEEAAATHEE
ncbi:MAG TPA: hypothetical protein VK190_03365 [Pseudoneobacillus sp.]|jgi:hypothetical protein|nr:hypothetical protein [Pseudoneobacillus sp.]